MAESLRALIQRVALATATDVSDGVAAALTTWIDRIERWNARMDLTAARSREELVDLMVADAMVLAARIASRARLVDVGTGAGAPGLPLALLRPDLKVTLVEPLGKRASFLSATAGVLGRRDVTIERERGEALVGRMSWDVAVSRATLSPDAWLNLGAQLVEADGRVWV
ncbi:MAG: RsmG family class I SAM-dependent methyltransferase, partial [Polyangiaceae bacterium]